MDILIILISNVIRTFNFLCLCPNITFPERTILTALYTIVRGPTFPFHLSFLYFPYIFLPYAFHYGSKMTSSKMIGNSHITKTITEEGCLKKIIKNLVIDYYHN